jgi:hypothetical protein
VSFFRIPSPSGGAERAKKGRTVAQQTSTNAGTKPKQHKQTIQSKIDNRSSQQSKDITTFTSKKWHPSRE